MSFTELNLYSKVLQMNVDIDMVIPYAADMEKKLKTVWLYHGGYGDHADWVRNTNAIRFAEERGIAVIMPCVHNSCFVNMLNGPAYGTYVGEELPMLLRSMFPALSQDRLDNYVCGFSNGGYGCIRTGLFYPETFGYVGAFAAGDQDGKAFADDGSDWARNRIAMFGAGDLGETEYSLKHCARELLRTKRVLPVIYHAVGEFDPWNDDNRKVKDFFEGFEGNPFGYHFVEYQGLGHTNVFREKALDDFLHYRGIGENSRI